MRMLSVSYLPEDCSSLLVYGALGRMFDASLERLSVTETSYNNSLAERVTRSTIQTLPATLPEPYLNLSPRPAARDPLLKKPQGPVPRSATVDLVFRTCLTERGSAVADRGAWAGFLGNISRLRGIRTR